ncbi:hypothetical protein AB205_0067560 [Aquarana catesbeiana]|uniref:GST N-terminal domain-containing protein n=1 Tax=Aquarana catesbeiana TaxID=8400 RepID=A0A2G9QH59_AQUCT|nr:hypothetical protein AB205_0067560 [Aquarana catesbeiana]
MSDKPVLYYFNGRGKMESIRWALAAVGVEGAHDVGTPADLRIGCRVQPPSLPFEEKLYDTKEEYEKLLKSTYLLFFVLSMFAQTILG